MTTKHFDIVIVGAGLSGIGLACHLQQKCPKKNYAILEGRDAMGGTWDLFRYPGIRSDSDMHTLGYNFKPWREEKAIADGPSILKYVQETAAEYNVNEHILYGHLVKKATWSSADVCWKVEAKLKETEETVQITCNYLLMCSGYYSYEGGYTPEFTGRELFKGDIIHPQKWPNGFDYKDKTVVVIGSGATAVTLIPAMAEDVKHITMLQRSPSYVLSLPSKDIIANFLRKILPEKVAYAITRWKNVTRQQFLYKNTRTKPEKMKKWIIGMVRQQLNSDYDIKTHFTPNYNPWDQRLCLVPNNDLFKSIRSGKASVVTDHIDTFTEKGILLKSGKELEADVIITATGLNLVILGGAEFMIDDQPIEFSKTYTYKGIMYSDVPNLITTFGYVNASWTLRADLISEYICRLINHMDEKGLRQFTPHLRSEDKNMKARPWIENFSSGYIQRVIHQFPKQGEHKPWINVQDYNYDKKVFKHEAIEDESLVLS